MPVKHLKKQQPERHTQDWCSLKANIRTRGRSERSEWHWIPSCSQAVEVEENLLKTKEELQQVRSSPYPAAQSSSSSSDSESDHEHSEEHSTYSAELQTQDINDHRREEDRLTEAEKNERLQRQLRVSSGSRPNTDWPKPVSDGDPIPPHCVPSAGPELRAGTSPGPQPEVPDWPAACWKHARWPWQVQDPASNPSGQHQAEDWWIWGLVETSGTRRYLHKYLTKAVGWKWDIIAATPDLIYTEKTC